MILVTTCKQSKFFLLVTFSSLKSGLSLYIHFYNLEKIITCLKKVCSNLGNIFSLKKTTFSKSLRTRKNEVLSFESFLPVLLKLLESEIFLESYGDTGYTGNFLDLDSIGMMSKLKSQWSIDFFVTHRVILMKIG